jgi:exodeoxyribonuclease VII small subunit
MPMTDPNELSYEQAFAELEEIVYSLEANQKSLEESIALFERGQSLALRCTALLDQAELRVRMLSAEELAEADDSEPEPDQSGPRK